ncbi:MAG: thioredoxin domain-containing protein [Candidatus Sulfobium sp.]|jgi:thioredoxin 2
MAEGTVLLRCHSCGTVNRIPVSKLGAQPKCGKCRSVLDFPVKPVEVTASNFDREVLDHPGAALIFFWAPWCAHCRAMIPLMEEVAREKAGMIKVGMINSEKEPALARRFEVMSVPRLILYRYGKKLNELNGEVRKGQLEEWIVHSLGR